MAFYGYDPMAAVPDYSGYSKAAQQFGSAIEKTGQAIDTGLARRESKASIYAKSAAFLNDIPELDSKYKQAPPPSPGESPEAYQDRVSNHIKTALVTLQGKIKDPAVLQRIALKADAQFKEEAEGFRQEAVQQTLTPEAIGKTLAGGMSQQQQADLVQMVPAEAAAPQQIASGNVFGENVSITEPQETFNKRQAGAYNRAAYDRSSIGSLIEMVKADPTASAKDKSDLARDLIKLELTQMKASQEKEKVREDARYKMMVQELSDFLQKGGTVYDTLTGKKVASADVDVTKPEDYTWGKVVKPPTTINYGGRVDKTGFIYGGQTYSDKDIQNIRVQYSNALNRMQKAEIEGIPPQAADAQMVQDYGALIQAYNQARYSGLMPKTPPASKDSNFQIIEVK